MNHFARHCISRRSFIKALTAAAALQSGGCGSDNQAMVFTEAQKVRKAKGQSTVALIPCQSYEENLSKLLSSQASELGLPDFKNKVVVVKPNMVEFNPDKPIHTNPAMVTAIATFIDSLGAREVIVAEGPGHFRDTEYLLDATGIGKACRKIGVRFVDLNLDNLHRLDNAHGLTRQKHFYFPKTIVEADYVVSAPKLKTHHWVGLTASMKNLFGTVPGAKYGWPKNILHLEGIKNSIIDVVHLVRPVLAVVDGIVAMEGDGPVNGTAKEAGVIAMGCDLAAVDATCARLMKIDPTELEYLQMASVVVGNIDSKQITIVGSPVESLIQNFALPITFQDKSLSKYIAQQGS